MHAPRRPTNQAEFEQELQLFQAIVEDEQKRKALVQTTGNDAQEWLDLLQLLAEYPDVPKALRSSIFNVMIRLSRNSGLHPQCLTIQNVERLGEYPEGGGAFGDVWKGKIGGTLVCVKVIRAFSATDIEKMLKDYMQEAIVWRQLNHRNLLPFMGIFYLDNNTKRLCLVSPWMTHGNLVEFLKEAPPNVVDRDTLAEDVACGLAHLHEMKIVHGDLKGLNVLITPDFRACIGDFGLSRISDSQRFFTHSSRSKGTIRWMPPELLKPGPSCIPSRESDVYAYGCVCYEIFAGHVPFPELSTVAVLYAVLIENRHPSRPEESSELQDPMWDIMVSCWDVSPSSRPRMTDIAFRIREMGIGRNRTSGPAAEWSDPRHTQIWSDVEHPTISQADFPTLRSPSSPLSPERIVDPETEDEYWFLGSDLDSTNLLLNDHGEIKGGTIEALVERLTSHDSLDLRYSRVFLLTFKSFTTLDKLFDLLVSRYRIQPPPNLTQDEHDEWVKMKQEVVQARVVQTLRMIVTSGILEEEDMYILEDIWEFATSLPLAEKSLLCALLNRAREYEDVYRIVIPATTQTPPPTPSIMHIRNTNLELLGVEPPDLARQLTLIEIRLFRKLRPIEFLHRAYSQQSENFVDNIAPIIQTCNRMINWTVSSVLSKPRSRQRGAIARHLISVADQCRILNNFSSMMAIMTGLNAPPIRRLKRTWAHVPQQYMARFGVCEIALNNHRNSKKHLEALSLTLPACVPFIGVPLIALTFIEENNPNTLPGNSNDLINFEKRRMSFDVIDRMDRIRQWQVQSSYNLQAVPAIQKYIEESLLPFDETRVSTERFSALSLEREPETLQENVFRYL
ncbi:cell division cycle- protein [Marasmius sp. AFHP31]|nr:cell division cycle- protein [Marasmius sp. AFHP31]